MRQILYISSKTPGQEISVGNILIQSRRNNDAAGVTGLLYTDGTRFLVRSTSGSSALRPIKRFTEKIVFCGFVIA